MRDVETEVASVGEPEGRLVLLVYGEHGLASHSLPPRGKVVIGRDVDCDVQIEDPQVSRSHATLHLGETPRIEDLGSANGTQVRGRSIAAQSPIALGIGDPVQIGAHILVVQRSQIGERLRRVHGPSYLEARIEEECANASRGGGGFTLARIAIEGSAGHRGLAVLAAELRPTDIVAVYGGAVFGVLFVATPPEAARVIVDRVERRMRESGMLARTAIAGCPRDGRSADALIGHVVAALDGRRDDGGAAARVVASPKMRAVFQLAERIAQSEINVLLLGETGVGKDVLAQHLHRVSSRAAGPFLRLNCASLSETLLESELFGHERGAFTGAAGAKPGLLETATGGTVFLDEVGELPLSIQAKLLQVIEVREVLRVGGLTPHPIDVRFVAATNRDLELQIERGVFRSDLYYRLNGIAITIPPLRDRADEILPLARHFLTAARRAHDITPAAAHALQGYAWPGNVRELRNVVERAALLADDGAIDIEHLPLDRMRSVLRVGAEPPVPPAEKPAPVPALSADKAAERQRIIDALADCAGNQSHAARKLGIARTTLIARIEEYAIPRPRKR